MPPPPLSKKGPPPLSKKGPPPTKKGKAPKSSLPPPPKRGPPPPPPPPAVFAEARSNDEHLAGISASPTAARAVARSDDEHLNSVRNAGERRVNISEARGNDDHLDSIKMGGTVRGFNSLMGEIGAGAELRSAETVDKSGPVLESEDHDIASTESPALLLKDLIPFFPDTKEFLRKVETVDKSAPVIDEEIRITFTDPDDTTNPHLKAIAAAAEKRSYRLMMKLKAELSGVFSSSGITLERAFRGFDENRDGVIDHAEFERGLKSLGAEIEPQQLDDLIAILDKDGDGSIDYSEFARWFGAGPPPPPELPEVRGREEAREQADSTVDSSEHLNAIRQKAIDLGTAEALKAAPPPLKKSGPPPLKKGPPPLKKGPGGVPPPPLKGPLAPPPLPPPTAFVEEARDNSEHLDAIKDMAGVRNFGHLVGEIGAGAELKSTETVDKSAPVLEAGDGRDVTESPALLLKDLIPHFPDTKEFLRKVETVDKSKPMIDENAKITFSDPTDTTNPHLKAIAAAAKKRSYRLMMKLQAELSDIFTVSGITLERAFRGFDENR